MAVRLFELVKAGEADGADVTSSLRRATSSWIGVPANDPFTEEERERTLQSAWRSATPKGAPKRQRVNAAPRAIDPNVEGFERLDLRKLRNLPAPSWVIEGIVPQGMTLLLGRYGSLKSWLALDWAAGAASQGKRVLYFVGEDLHGFGSRVVDLADVRGVDLANLEIVPDTPKLMREGELDRLHKTVSDEGADFIVIDHWGSAIPGTDENSFSDVTPIIDMLRQIEKEHECSTLIVAHTNWQDSRMRGHTSVEDGSDGIWHAKKDETILGAAQVTNKKLKNAPLAHPLDISLRRINDRTVLHPSVLDEP